MEDIDDILAEGRPVPAPIRVQTIAPATRVATTQAVWPPPQYGMMRLGNALPPFRNAPFHNMPFQNTHVPFQNANAPFHNTPFQVWPVQIPTMQFPARARQKPQTQFCCPKFMEWQSVPHPYGGRPPHNKDCNRRKKA